MLYCEQACIIVNHDTPSEREQETQFGAKDKYYQDEREKSDQQYGCIAEFGPINCWVTNMSIAYIESFKGNWDRSVSGL